MELRFHFTNFREIWCQDFSKICQENSNVIKIWEEYRLLYMKTIYIFDHISLNSSMNYNFSERLCRENQITNSWSIILFGGKSCRLWENMETYRKSGQAAENNTAHVHSCWIPKATNTYSEYVIFISCPLWQWLDESASKLHFIYIACLVKFSDEGDSNRGPLKC